MHGKKPFSAESRVSLQDAVEQVNLQYQLWQKKNPQYIVTMETEDVHYEHVAGRADVPHYTLIVSYSELTRIG